MTDQGSKLTSGMTPEAGFRRIAAQCGQAFATQVAAVMTDDNAEGPHRARIALRRFRSVLAGFSPVIDPDARRDMAGRARALFRCLGRLRDADVLQAGCRDPAAVAGLGADADRVRAEVRIELTTLDAAGFAPTLGARLAGADWLRGGKTARRWHRRGLDRLGRRALGRAWQACVAHGPDLAALDTEPRHELRKDLKTLRYLSEYFAPFWPGRMRDRFLDHLRGLQDHLGVLNDLALARAPSDDNAPTDDTALSDDDPASDDTAPSDDNPASDANAVSANEIAAMAAARDAWKSLQKIGPFWT